MAPPVLQEAVQAEIADPVVRLRRPWAPETWAARRHGHFDLKPAPAAGAAGTPAGRDFRPGKEEDIK